MQDNFTALPFAVTLKGPLQEISCSVDTAGLKDTTEVFGALTDTMTYLLQGCREVTPEDDAKADSQNRPNP